MSPPGTPVEPNPRVTFRVRHEDDDVLVVEKASKVVTQPGVGHQHDTLLNGLFATHGPRLRNLGRARDFGLVHRLDRETSGLLVVALSARAYDGLRAQFERRSVRKFYWATTLKAPKEPSGVVRRPILEETTRTSRYTAQKLARLSPAGKPALTAWRVLEASPLAALIEARPITGRLHQVRVHLASIGAGVLGDALYGPRRLGAAAPRLALHAHRIVFEHPVGGAGIDVRSPFPRDLRGLLRTLKLRRPDLDADPEVGAARSAQDAHQVRGDPVGEEEA